MINTEILPSDDLGELDGLGLDKLWQWLKDQRCYALGRIEGRRIGWVHHQIAEGGGLISVRNSIRDYIQAIAP